MKDTEQHLLKLATGPLSRLFGKKSTAQHNSAFIHSVTVEQFSRAGVPAPRFEVDASHEPFGSHDVILRRDRGYVMVLFPAKADPVCVEEITDKVAVYLHLFSHVDKNVREIVVNASDGDAPGLANYKFSAATTDVTLVPDAHFFRDRGYDETDEFAATQAPAWRDRSDKIIWRGQTNGIGLFSLDKEMSDCPGVIQRLRMALKCQDLDVDFRFIRNPFRPNDRLLAGAGLAAGPVPTHDWGGMKYAIDIDGITNTWCNFMQRLKLGCCVLKVESPFGFRQWYYHKLIPWEHYVPIRADLSDLAEQIDWVRANPSAAEAIAARGQSFARTLDFETECTQAVGAIEDREQSR